MQVTETSTEGLHREFKVVVPYTDIDAEVDGRLRELAPTVRLPGFRPGKVPAALLKKRFGASLMGEVLEKTVNETSQKTLEERGLRPAGQPKIEVTAFDQGADLEYNLSVDLMPDFEPVDFSTLTVERMKAEAEESEVDAALERLGSQQKSSEPLKRQRKSRDGDILVINYVGTVDGVAFEGGTADGHNLELGSNSFIPGFEAQLVGQKTGDKIDVEVTFPEAYPQPDLAGKPAVFATEVVEIREPVPVEINDDFAKLFGMEDLAGLREAVKGQLEQEYGNMSRARLKRTLLDTLEEKHQFEVPTGMVNEEYEAICRQVNPPAQAEGHDHDHAHDHDHDHDHAPAEAQPAADEGFSDEDKGEYRTIANRRVRLGLLLSEVGRLNNIQVNEEEVRRAIMQEASKYPGQERQVVEFYQQNQQAQASVRAPLFEDKVVDFILEMASVNDRDVTVEELMRDDAAEEAAEAAEEKPKAKAKAKPKAKAKKEEAGDESDA
jgi:trigger factor